MNSLPPGGDDRRREASPAKLFYGVYPGLSGDRCVACAVTEGSQAPIRDDRQTGLVPRQVVREEREDWPHEIVVRRRDGKHLVLKRGDLPGKTPRGSAPCPGERSIPRQWRL